MEHAALADLDNDVVDLNFQEEMRRSQMLTRNMRFVKYYWEELTDVDEHVRLQRAVKSQLYRDRFGDDSDGNAVDTCNPFVKYDSN